MLTFQAQISKELNASPNKVWEVIGAVEGVEKWFSSMITSCKVENGKRFCLTAEGIPLVEDIIEVNHENKTFRFGIPTQEMLPADAIVETMKVIGKDNGKAIVEWSAEFKATTENGPIVQEAFQTLWNMGLTEMEKFITQNQ